jgi:multidrug efflux pump subunit AcrA (membrane-fusion protein)
MKFDKKTAGAFIFGVLVLLLFFSKTIYTYNIPVVTGTRPVRGSLSKIEISSGIATWAETETIYAACAGAVGKVFVREGDHVEEGDVLFEMDFDMAAAQRRYAEIGNNIGKLETEIQGLRSRLSIIREALANDYLSSFDDHDFLPVDYPASSETPGVETTRPVSGQAGLIAIELERAAMNLRNTRIFYEMRFQSRSELIDAENTLKTLLYKYEAEAEELERTLALKSIDLENLRLSRETAAETLRDYRNNAVVRAPAAGTILGLTAERGKFFQENALLASIGVGREFTVECPISLDNNFVSPGDACVLSNASHVLRGTVWRIRPTAQGKTISISVISEEASDGETFEVTFEKSGAASFTLVPSSAINRDNDGYFLYQIKRRKGIMGDEYYLERLNIFIGDSDHRNTQVVRGITFFEPIVLVSNKSLSAGINVTLKNPEDFFEN